MHENEISFIIRGAIFKIYNMLGPGLFESVYEITLAHELRKEGLEVKTQYPIPLIHDGIKMEIGFRCDLLVEDKVIVEIKSIEYLNPVHHKQVLTYLRLSEIKLGLLVNFNTPDISQAIYRKVNSLDYTK